MQPQFASLQGLVFSNQLQRQSFQRLLFEEYDRENFFSEILTQ